MTWTAAPDGGIPADQFGVFRISAKLPDADSVSFPTTQTYADGAVVKWDQAPRPAAPSRNTPRRPWRWPGSARSPPISRPRPNPPRPPPPPRHRSRARWSTTPPDPRRRRAVRRRPRCRPRADRAGDHEPSGTPRRRRAAAGSGRVRHHADAGAASAHAARVAADPADNAVSQHRPGSGQRDLQRGSADHVRGDDGGRPGWQPVDGRRPAGARHGRQRRRTSVGPGRQLHGQLPGDVGRRPRRRGVVVIPADRRRHRHARPGRRSAPTTRPTICRSGLSSWARWSWSAAGRCGPCETDPDGRPATRTHFRGPGMMDSTPPCRCTRRETAKEQPDGRPAGSTGRTTPDPAPEPPLNTPAPPEPPQPPADTAPPAADRRRAGQPHRRRRQKPRRKRPRRKAPAKKAAPKKARRRKAAKKAPAKKAAAKKAPAKKAPRREGAGKEGHCQEDRPGSAGDQRSARRGSQRCCGTREINGRSGPQPAARSARRRVSGRSPVPFAVAIAISLLAVLLVRQPPPAGRLTMTSMAR